jgi:hypothetical protein
MDNNDYSSLNYISMNPLNKNFASPIKEQAIFQPNGYVIRENYQNIQNNIFYNNISNFVTPKKDHNLLDPEMILSPFVSNSKIDASNNKYLITTICKNSLNDLSPFRPMNSPYMNNRIIEKT